LQCPVPSQAPALPLQPLRWANPTTVVAIGETRRFAFRPIRRTDRQSPGLASTGSRAAGGAGSSTGGTAAAGGEAFDDSWQHTVRLPPCYRHAQCPRSPQPFLPSPSNGYAPSWPRRLLHTSPFSQKSVSSEESRPLDTHPSCCTGAPLFGRRSAHVRLLQRRLRARGPPRPRECQRGRTRLAGLQASARVLRQKGARPRRAGKARARSSAPGGCAGCHGG
jgi:hypothetical protein